jgi:hypothetical protein
MNKEYESAEAGPGTGPAHHGTGRQPDTGVPDGSRGGTKDRSAWRRPAAAAAAQEKRCGGAGTGGLDLVTLSKPGSAARVYAPQVGVPACLPSKTLAPMHPRLSMTW